MKFRNFFLAAVSTLVIASIGQGRAEAGEVLYDGTGFLQGTQSFVQSFNLTSPGTLTVTLTNVAWPQSLASLNMLLTSASGIVGSEMGAGTAVFDIKKGDDIFAHWFGTAQGPLNTGLYSLKIDFQAAGGGTPVPLPTSILLLLSGLGLLIWHRRTHAAGSDIGLRVAYTPNSRFPQAA